jgi:hypothetical protein
MGQLIAFPPTRQPVRRPRAQAAPRERAARPQRPRPALELLYGLTYALGLFLAAPVLVLVAFDGVFAGEPLTSLGALVLLALVLPLAAAARRRV